MLDFNNLSDYFLTWEKQFVDYQNLVESKGLSLIEFALNYVLSVPEIDKVLVGVNNEKQLIEIVNATKKQAITNAFIIDDLNLLNPSRWKV